MNFLRKILEVFKAYTYGDRLLSVVALAVFLLMIVKMIIFPYGLFGFGENNIYTEGLVSKNGIQNVNPLFVDYNEADREISRLVFSGLMKYDPEKKAVVDDMANLTISEDKTQYSFVLREGLKWHDGEPVTVDDVFFTFNDLILNPAFQNDILKTNFAGVKIEKIDGKTVKFTLNKPNVFFVSNFLTGILPRHLLKDIAPEDILQADFNKKPVGSGPYMITEPVGSFSDGRTQVTLERNPDYYGEKSEIELMRFVVYQSMDDLIEQVASVNGVVKVSGGNIADFSKNERFKLIPYQLPQYTAVFMNMESKMLKDNRNVRLALLKSVDKELLIGEDVDKVRVDTPLMELEQKDWSYKSDSDQANKVLEDAGYEYNEEDTNHEGVRYDTDGNALDLVFIARLYDEGTYQFEETRRIVTFLLESWKKIGFNIQIQFLPPEQFNEKISKREYDLLLVGQNLGYNSDAYSYWHSTQAGPLGQNLSNYKTFRVDSLIEDMRSVFDSANREGKVKELAKILQEDVPAIFLYTPVYYYAIDTKVTGVKMEGVVFPSDRLAGMALWKFRK